MRELLRVHKASPDLIVNHQLRLFGGIVDPFQVQISIRMLLWLHAWAGGGG